MKFVLENSDFEWRTQSTWKTGEVEYYLVGLHLKFVLENSGEFRAHGKLENVEYLVGLYL